MLVASGIVRVVSEPETRTLPSGSSIVDFRAVVNNWSGGKEVPTWMNCYIWDDGNSKTAKFIKDNLKKGSSIQISGSLENEEFIDKEGNKKTYLKIHLFEKCVRFAGDKKKDSEETKEPVKTKESAKTNKKDQIDF